MTYPTRGRSIGRVPADVFSAVQKWRPQPPTTAVERLLLLTTIVVLALEPYLPGAGGKSPSFIMFAILAVYLLLRRPGMLAKTWIHPVFLAAFGFLFMGILIESVHPLSRYNDIFRIAQMFIAAIFVASLCRDRQALRTGIYGLLIAGVLTSLLLFLTAYGALRIATATDFSEASKLRGQALTGVPQSANAMVVFAPQAAAVALALGLKARSSWRRNLFLAVSLFCVVGAFLPMSRSAMLMVGASCSTVLFAYGLRHMKVILITAVLALGVLIWVPQAVFARFTLTPEVRAGKMEGRVHVYTAAIHHLPEYIVMGVGAGNFWGPWGMQSNFYRGGVLGGHNAFIHVTLFWGVAALLTLILVVYLSYHSLPSRENKDVLALCLYGLAVPLILYMMFSHVLAAKAFSLGLGLIVGSRLWIWPKGTITTLRRRQSSRYRTLEHAS